jgi:hypothetical protein
MSNIEYENIKAYRVTQRLRGMPANREDAMAERLRCGGCGAPAGYFCLSEQETKAPGGTFWHVTRMTCKGIIGSQNPRTLLAFARGAEEILAREAKEKAAK